MARTNEIRLRTVTEANYHTLNPVGRHRVNSHEVRNTTLDAALEHLSQPTLDEVAWIDFSKTPAVILTGKDDVVQERRFARVDSGRAFLATGWGWGNEYSFESLSQLKYSDNLSSYTAAWFAQWVKANRIDYKSDPIYTALADKPELADEGDTFPEDRAAKARRLMMQLLEETPELGHRYVARGMIEEDELPHPPVDPPAVRTKDFTIKKLSTQQLKFLTSPTGLSKPGKAMDAATGLPVDSRLWPKPIIGADMDEGNVVVRIEQSSHIRPVREMIAIALKEFEEAKARSRERLGIREQ